MFKLIVLLIVANTEDMRGAGRAGRALGLNLLGIVQIIRPVRPTANIYVVCSLITIRTHLAE